ncbi:TetR/AcrR family transcriptional regulator [Amycolatopsis pithecellobii]|uniref:TetR family transcriptional regulator n=1 Tax=Amycolatopsis pithecellobii TaxID=664692 RepID=A0A6N7ZD04_9PSEU|nr:TetR/AcrR family transcriptional regulator [Amycolatopsis pithecellobii]MTD59618.1 TetR family transcriptional regulator [Amycolatopsis pithecellobii]
MSQSRATGRVNQKRRTREAILRAAAELVRSGRTISMPEVARAAAVSEATAYRHFPDLAGLLRETITGTLFTPAEALEAVAGSRDPVERIAVATEYLLRHALAHQSAIRAVIAATITGSAPGARPDLRLALIDQALAPLAEDLGHSGSGELDRLKRELAFAVGSEGLFFLIDHCGLTPDEAIATVVHATTTLTRVAQAHATSLPRQERRDMYLCPPTLPKKSS